MQSWWIELIILAGSGIGGWVAARAALVVLRRLVPPTAAIFERSLVARLAAPGSALVAVVAVAIADAVRSSHLQGQTGTIVVHALYIALVVVGAWLAFQCTYVIEDAALSRLGLERADNLKLRRVQTQIHVFRKVAAVAIVVIAGAAVLFSFANVRAAGAGLLASAGIVAILAGVAARPVASNLIAGIQIAITQPIRVDDVVVLDGHWGRIEEITLSYVVIRVWDLRRLVVPISYLITTPFENWTRTTSDILGFVHLEVDYTAPVEAMRERFEEICRASPNWDGNVATLQVTGIGPSTMQIRCLMSAADSSKSWDLQCTVREQLIAFLRDEHPEALAHLRLAATAPAGPASTPAGTSASGTGLAGCFPAGPTPSTPAAGSEVGPEADPASEPT